LLLLSAQYRLAPCITEFIIARHNTLFVSAAKLCCIWLGLWLRDVSQQEAVQRWVGLKH